MITYVDAVKVAIYAKLRSELESQYDGEQAGRLSAAVVNRLFASDRSPVHADLSATQIEKLAMDFLCNETDKDIHCSIVMSLRTLMTIETDAGNTEATDRITNAVQWIKTIRPLPPEAPNPKMMADLATLLQARYCE